MTQFKIVPVEPTREMILHGENTIKGADTTFEGILAEMAYKSMLAAAPSPWISVGERLPENTHGRTFAVVLVATLEGVEMGYFSKGEWFVDGQEGWADCEDVTHWMPLPEAPGAKERSK